MALHLEITNTGNQMIRITNVETDETVDVITKTVTKNRVRVAIQCSRKYKIERVDKDTKVRTDKNGNQ